MMNQPKVLITNVYSYLNKGDAAIVIALVQEIERTFGKNIKIQTTDINHDGNKYGYPISGTLPWIILSSVRDRSIFKQLLHIALSIICLNLFLALYSAGVSLKWLLGKDLKTFVNDVENSDLAIACGGGYLRTASGSMRNALLLYVTCLNFMAAKRMGKKVYLYSQSIGPVYGGLQQLILRRALNAVDIIEPREDISVNYLRSLNLSKEVTIVQTADPVLLLGGYGKYDSKKTPLSKGMNVGLTVRKWFKTEEELHSYLKAVAKTVDYLAENYGAFVYYVPQVIAENYGDDDRLVAKKLVKLVKNKANFKLIELDLSPKEIIGLCDEMYIFIGTRMHSNIFSLINNVPVIAIEYEHKTRGIMIGLGLEDLVIDIQDITPDLLLERVKYLLANREMIAQKIKANMPRQIELSRSAIDVIWNGCNSE